MKGCSNPTVHIQPTKHSSLLNFTSNSQPDIHNCTRLRQPNTTAACMVLTRRTTTHCCTAVFLGVCPLHAVQQDHCWTFNMSSMSVFFGVSIKKPYKAMMLEVDNVLV